MIHLSQRLSIKVLARINKPEEVTAKPSPRKIMAKVSMISLAAFVMTSCTTEQSDTARNTDYTFRKAIGIYKTIEGEIK